MKYPTTTAILSRPSLAAAVALALLTSQSVQAAVSNWDGDTDTAWANAANWDVLPADSLVTDIANFNLAAYPNQPDAGTRSINGITVGSSSAALTISGVNLSIGNSGISIANGASTVLLQPTTVTLGAAQTWTNNSASLFTVSSAVAKAANLLTIDGTGNTTLGGIVSGTGTASNLTKNGAGTLTLSNTNTYTGLNTINAGTVAISADANLGNAANDVAFAGGTLQINGTFSMASGRNLAVAGSTGTVEVTGANVLTDAGTLTGSSGTLIKSGSGTLVLTAGSGAFDSSTLRVDAGVLQLGGTLSTLLVGDTTNRSTISLNGGSILIQQTGADSTRAFAANLSVDQSGTINVNRVTLAGAGFVNSFNTTSIGSGNTLTVVAGAGITSGTSTLGLGALTLLGNASIVSTNNTTGALSTVSFGTTTGTNTNLSLSGTGNITNTNSIGIGTGSISKSGSGSLIFNGASAVHTFTGDVNLSGGSIVINATGGNTFVSDFAVGTGTTFSVEAGSSIAALKDLSGSGGTVNTGTGGAKTLTLTGSGTTTFSGSLANGTGALAITKSGSGTQTFSGTNTHTGLTTVSGGILSLTGSFAGSSVSVSGTGTFNESATGTISGANSFTQNAASQTSTLAGNNTYTGVTTVNGGTLLVNGTHTASTTNGAYSVGAAGKLGGSGSITAISLTAAAGGKLTPGGDGTAANLTFTLGTAIVTGNMNLSASSNNTGAYIFDLATLASSDRITITQGTLNLGTLDFTDFTFNALGGFGAGVYTLFDASSAITNTLGTTTGTIGLNNATLSYDATTFDILLTVDPVPEPSTVGMILGGFGLLLFVQRRRRIA